MTVRPVRLFGDPVLRTPAQEVTDFDRQLRRLVKDLTQTLRDQDGAGLSAPQIGVGLRVFVFDVDGVRGHLINPVLGFPDDAEEDGPEGCLSFPGMYYDVKRRLNTVATGVDADGRPVRVVGDSSWPGASSTRPTTWTACCSSTGWTARPGSGRCGRSARRTGPGWPRPQSGSARTGCTA